jgi:hypothetical protein
MGEGKLLFLTSEEGTSGVEGCVVEEGADPGDRSQEGVGGELVLEGCGRGRGEEGLAESPIGGEDNQGRDVRSSAPIRIKLACLSQPLPY